MIKASGDDLRALRALIQRLREFEECVIESTCLWSADASVTSPSATSWKNGSTEYAADIASPTDNRGIRNRDRGTLFPPRRPRRAPGTLPPGRAYPGLQTPRKQTAGRSPPPSRKRANTAKPQPAFEKTTTTRDIVRRALANGLKTTDRIVEFCRSNGREAMDASLCGTVLCQLVGQGECERDDAGNWRPLKLKGAA